MTRLRARRVPRRALAARQRRARRARVRRARQRHAGEQRRGREHQPRAELGAGLRRRAAPRLERRPRAPRRRRRHRERPGRAAATGSSAPTAASSRSATRRFFGSTGSEPLERADRRHRRDPRRARLLARRRRRRRVRLRRRRRSTARPPACPLAAPIVAHRARPPTGSGYWLVGADGGVFAFGDAALPRLGRRACTLASPIVGAAATTAGHGYWLRRRRRRRVRVRRRALRRLAARSRSTRRSASPPSANGDGYWVARADGSVGGFGDAASPATPSTARRAPSPHPNTVGIAASAGRRLLVGARARSTRRRRSPTIRSSRARVATSRTGRRLPGGQPGRHLPRRVPVRPVDLEQRGAAGRPRRPRRCRSRGGGARRPGPARDHPVPRARHRSRGAVAAAACVVDATRRPRAARRPVSFRDGSDRRRPISRSAPSAITGPGSSSPTR